MAFTSAQSEANRQRAVAKSFSEGAKKQAERDASGRSSGRSGGKLSTPNNPTKVITLPEGSSLSGTGAGTDTLVLYTNKYGQLTGKDSQGGFNPSLQGKNIDVLNKSPENYQNITNYAQEVQPQPKETITYTKLAPETITNFDKKQSSIDLVSNKKLGGSTPYNQATSPRATPTEQLVYNLRKKKEEVKVQQPNSISEFKPVTTKEKHGVKYYVDKGFNYYDKTIGKVTNTFGEQIQSEWETARRREEIKKYGEAGVQNLGYGASVGTNDNGTQSFKGFKQLSDTELIKVAPYTAEETITNKEQAKLNSKIQTEVDNLTFKYEEEGNKKINTYSENLKNKYQDKLNNKEISLENANLQYQSELDEYTRKLSDEQNIKANEELQKAIKPKIEETTFYLEGINKKSERAKTKANIIPSSIALFGTGIALALTGPAGIVVGSAMTVRTALDTPKIVSGFISDPVKATYETLPALFSFGAGYKVGSKIKGETGNLRLASKISKLPKDLNYKIFVDYTKNLTSTNIKSLTKVEGDAGSIVVGGRGGIKTLKKSGEGITYATFEGKNYKGSSVTGADGFIQGVVKRTFRNTKFYKQEYVMKYEITPFGKRTTTFFKGDKEIAKIVDKVSNRMDFTEQLPSITTKKVSKYQVINGEKIRNVNKEADLYAGEFGTLFNKNMLDKSTSVLESSKVKTSTRNIKGVEGKFTISGELKNVLRENEIIKAEPTQFNEITKLVANINGKKGSAVDIQTIGKRTILSTKKGNTYGSVNYKIIQKIVDGGSITTIKAKQVKLPKVDIYASSLIETIAVGKITKNRGTLKNILNKISKQTDSNLNSNRLYSSIIPTFNFGSSKLKVAEQKVKSGNRELNIQQQRINRIMGISQELRVKENYYLMSIKLRESELQNEVKVKQLEMPILTKQRIKQLEYPMPMKQLEMPMLTKQRIKMDSKVKTKQELKQDLIYKIVNKNNYFNNNFRFKTKIPKFKIPTFILPPINVYKKRKIKSIINKKRYSTSSNQGYTEDFTAKLLGIRKQVKRKDVEKEIRTVRTGGNVRQILQIMR